MNQVARPNKHLIALVERKPSEFFAEQKGFDWNRSLKKWTEAFPVEEKFLNSLPKKLDRGKVREVCDSDFYSVLQKFLATMVWGYGDIGYGPYRVSQMLGQANSLHILESAIQVARSSGPLHAYAYFAGNRIKILGPSFGSKFLNFVTPREVGSPIYDSLIARWVGTFAKEDFLGVSTSSELWNLNTYSRYWHWIKFHAEKFGKYPDQMELGIFRAAEKLSS